MGQGTRPQRSPHQRLPSASCRLSWQPAIYISKPPASWPSCFTCGCPFWWCKTWTGSMLFFNHNRFMAIDFGFAFQSKTWNSMTHTKPTKPDRLWIRNSWVAAFSPLSFWPSCVAKIWTNHAWDGLKHALTGAIIHQWFSFRLKQNRSMNSHWTLFSGWLRHWWCYGLSAGAWQLGWMSSCGQILAKSLHVSWYQATPMRFNKRLWHHPVYMTMNYPAQPFTAHLNFPAG